MVAPDLTLVEGFEWDDGNANKNVSKHGVGQSESQQMFFNEPLIVVEDASHSQDEARFNALGKTDQGRLVHVTFTLRAGGKLIRVISARDMSGKERVVYGKAPEENS